MNQTCNFNTLAHAFGGTFVFFSTHEPTLKKSKRATKPKHQDSRKMDIHNDNGRGSTTGNTGFASGGLTCKLGALCFYPSSV